MEPDVSVVIRAHNAERTLRRAVKAALDQAPSTVEVVVVDDASTDGTARVAAEAAIEDPSVRVVSHADTLGRLESYRSGQRASRGRWIVFTDAGDRLEPRSLASLVEAADEAQAQVVVPSVEYVAGRAPAPVPADVPTVADALSRTGDTGDLSAARVTPDDVFDDRTTGSVARVVSPLMQTLEGRDVVDAMFVTRQVPVQIRGRLFSAELVRRAFAEIGIGAVASRDEAVLSFLAATLCPRLTVRPDLRSVTICTDDGGGTLSLEEFRQVCANRATAEVVVEYLNRTERWERYYDDWEGMALMLAGEAVACFPDRVGVEDWPAAADALLESWGAPYVCGAVAGGDADVAAYAVALASAQGLALEGGRVHRPAFLLHAGDDVARAKHVIDALGARRSSPTVLSDAAGPLPSGLSGNAALPPQDRVLDRARALEKALADAEADALVMLAGDERCAYDALVARAAGLPVAVVASEPLEGTAAYRRCAAQVALATCVVPADNVDGELWSIGSVRVTRENGLVSALSLGTPTRRDLDSRVLAIRLVRNARTFEETCDRLKEACAVAIDGHDRLETENAGLRDRVADLERRLEEACAENDELHDALDRSSQRGFRGGIFHRGAKG